MLYSRVQKGSVHFSPCGGEHAEEKESCKLNDHKIANHVFDLKSDFLYFLEITIGKEMVESDFELDYENLLKDECTPCAWSTVPIF